MSVTFKELIADPVLGEALEKLGFVTPTPVQKAVLPVLMNQGPKDVHGQAQTGTGKTLAFGLPLINRIDTSNRTVQGLVVVPTRELAVQVFDSLKPFAKALGIELAVLYGGMSISDQISRMKKGVQLVIGTPGRLNDHIARGSLNLDSLKTFALDEADIMFDMGFRGDIEELLTHANPTRELWLFAATVKSTIDDFIKKYMNNPLTIAVKSETTSTATIQQFYATVPFSFRGKALARFIDREKDFYGFIFCQTKLLTAEVSDDLSMKGYRAGALHGDMSQDQRNLVIKKFREGELKILVATDVAARGIDIPNLTHVINYSVPEDQETYVHRIGRTGRAGKKGVSITFVGKSEFRLLDGIRRKFSLTISPITIPTKDEIVDARLSTISEFVQTALAEKEGVKPTKATLIAKLNDLLQNYDDQSFKSLSVALLCNKFFRDIETEQDIPDFGGQQMEAQSEKTTLEVSINIGSEDGISQEIIRDHIQSAAPEEAASISRMRVSRHRTFIDVAREKAEQIIAKLQNTSLSGKTLFVQLVNSNNASFGSRGGFDRNRSGGRDGRRYEGGGQGRSRFGSRDRGGERSERFGGDRSERFGGRPSNRSYGSGERTYGSSDSRPYGARKRSEDGASSEYPKSFSDRPSGYEKREYTPRRSSDSYENKGRHFGEGDSKESLHGKHRFGKENHKRSNRGPREFNATKRDRDDYVPFLDE